MRKKKDKGMQINYLDLIPEKKSVAEVAYRSEGQSDP